MREKSEREIRLDSKVWRKKFMISIETNMPARIT